jgi:hypothetical protein
MKVNDKKWYPTLQIWCVTYRALQNRATRGGPKCHPKTFTRVNLDVPATSLVAAGEESGRNCSATHRNRHATADPPACPSTSAPPPRWSPATSNHPARDPAGALLHLVGRCYHVLLLSASRASARFAALPHLLYSTSFSWQPAPGFLDDEQVLLDRFLVRADCGTYYWWLDCFSENKSRVFLVKFRDLVVIHILKTQVCEVLFTTSCKALLAMEESFTPASCPVLDSGSWHERDLWKGPSSYFYFEKTCQAFIDFQWYLQEVLQNMDHSATYGDRSLKRKHAWLGYALHSWKL